MHGTTPFALAILVLIICPHCISVYPSMQPEYQIGYNDYPNDSIYTECYPYSYFAQNNNALFNEWHPWYTTKWRSPSFV